MDEKLNQGTEVDTEVKVKANTKPIKKQQNEIAQSPTESKPKIDYKAKFDKLSKEHKETVKELKAVKEEFEKAVAIGDKNFEFAKSGETQLQKVQEILNFEVAKSKRVIETVSKAFGVLEDTLDVNRKAINFELTTKAPGVK